MVETKRKRVTRMKPRDGDGMVVGGGGCGWFVGGRMRCARYSSLFGTNTESIFHHLNNSFILVLMIVKEMDLLYRGH